MEQEKELLEHVETERGWLALYACASVGEQPGTRYELVLEQPLTLDDYRRARAEQGFNPDVAANVVPPEASTGRLLANNAVAIANAILRDRHQRSNVRGGIPARVGPPRAV